jgi:homoserine kinase
VHASIALVLVTPAYQVETARARAVLPESLARTDAIQQAGHLALLLLGLERGDPTLLRSCLEDRIGEPARLSLYPGFAQARASALEAGAHGVCVSGAGPTVLALVTADDGDRVGAAMAAAYHSAGFASEVHRASVDQAGGRVVA